MEETASCADIQYRSKGFEFDRKRSSLLENVGGRLKAFEFDQKHSIQSKVFAFDQKRSSLIKSILLKAFDRNWMSSQLGISSTVTFKYHISYSCQKSACNASDKCLLVIRLLESLSRISGVSDRK